MSGDDDLGSFFAEINEIEVDPSNLQTPSVIHENDNQSLTQSVKQPIKQTVKSTPQVVVVAAAAPQVIEKPSHAIYTYDVPADVIQSSRTFEEELAMSQFYDTSGAFGTNQISQIHVIQPVIPKQDKKFVRTGGNETWVDDSLNEWPENDFRIFVGDLGKEVNTDMLAKAFQHYKSFAKAKVVKSKIENKGRGYGFVSFLDGMDCAKAMREMNNKYLGTRPMKIRKSTWKDRDIKEVRKSDKKKRKIEESLGLQ